MDAIIQDVEVYLRGDVVYARGQIDHVELFSSRQADLVLQKVVDLLAGTGGVVCLQRGDYVISNTLRLGSNVTLKGSGRATRLHVQAAMGIEAQSLHGITISDLALVARQGAEVGIVLDDCGDCLLRDVFCLGFRDYGIWLRNQCFLCEVRGCKLANNGKANLYFDHLFKDGRGGDFVPNLATNCICYGGGTGIETNRAIVLNLVGCVVFQPGNIGFHIHSVSNSVLLSGCRTFQCEKEAVVVDNAHEINISSSVFCWQRGHGIVLRDVAWGAVVGNEIIDSGVRVRQPPLTIGLYLQGETRGLQISGNAIFNWGDQLPMQGGIKEEDSCHDNNITDNNINYYQEFAVIAHGRGTIQANNYSVPSPAYMGETEPGYPDFTRDRIESFIKQLFAME